MSKASCASAICESNTHLTHSEGGGSIGGAKDWMSDREWKVELVSVRDKDRKKE